MGTELRIESNEACRLATEVAETTGTSIEQAVVVALRERLSGVRERAERVHRIMVIAADIRAHMTEPLPTSDHNWLYGEDGLPL